MANTKIKSQTLLPYKLHDSVLSKDSAEVYISITTDNW